MHFFRGQIVIADTVFNQHPLLSGVHMYNISFRVARRFMFLLQCKQDVLSHASQSISICLIQFLAVNILCKFSLGFFFTCRANFVQL